MLLLIAAISAAAVLQAVVIWELLADIAALRGQVCHLAVIQHLIVVGCPRLT